LNKCFLDLDLEAGMHLTFKVTSHKANSKTSILSHMIYFASTKRIEGSGDPSDSVIKKNKKMGRFFYLISCIYFIMIFYL
jgi:hypothetical protein